MPVRRATFVIDTDRTVLKVVANELRASVHADQTLWFLQNYKLSRGSSHVQEGRTGAEQQPESESEPSPEWSTEPENADAPNLVRPYTLTAGRTDAGIELPLEASIESLDTT